MLPIAVDAMGGDDVPGPILAGAHEAAAAGMPIVLVGPSDLAGRETADGHKLDLIEASEVIGMHDIFVFNQTGVNKDGAALGEFEATGIRPQCLDRFKSAGIELPLEMFERKTLSFDGASHFNNEN